MAASLLISVSQPVHGIRPAIDGPPRLTDCLGKNLLLIEALPSTAIVKLDKMSQGTARTEKLALGVLALHVGCERPGHGKSLAKKRKS
jgi:hypothetical protein